MSSASSPSTQRRVLLLLHPKREQARVSALEIARGLASSGIAVEHHLSSEGSGVPEITRYSGRPINEFELIIVLGGDGTMLRSAEISYGISIPILGINVGHMGFLAEADPQIPTCETFTRISSSAGWRISRLAIWPFSFP
jgi:NAD+ kinase